MQGIKLTWSISIFFKQIDKRSADKIQSKKYWGPFKYYVRDVSAGATGATAVAPKFSDTLTLSQPGEADFAHHYRGRT